MAKTNGSPKATVVSPQNLFLCLPFLTLRTGKRTSVLKKKSVFTKKIPIHASFVEKNVMATLI